MHSVQKSIGVLAALLMLVGCGKKDVIREGTVILPEPFHVQTVINYGELELEGEYRCSVTGESSLRLRFPENMNHCGFALSEGELTVTYDDLTFTVDDDVEPENSVLRVLSGVLKDFAGRSFAVPEGEGPFALSMQNAYGPVKAVVYSQNGKDFILQEISVDRLMFHAVFRPADGI